ncbi:MAG: hypothetical protein QM632_06085 [Micrococcaceae bacterium]
MKMNFDVDRRNFSKGLAGTAVVTGFMTHAPIANADKAIQTDSVGAPQLVSALPITPHTFADVRRTEGKNTTIAVTSSRAIGSARVTLSNADKLTPVTHDEFFVIKNVSTQADLTFDISCLSPGLSGTITLTQGSHIVDALNIICADGLFGVASFKDGLPVYASHDEALKMRPSLN